MDFDDDDLKEAEELGAIYADLEDAFDDGYTFDDSGYRGLFFSLEDAINYARDIGLPVVFVIDEEGVHLWVDYKE